MLKNLLNINKLPSKFSFTNTKVFTKAKGKTSATHSKDLRIKYEYNPFFIGRKSELNKLVKNYSSLSNFEDQLLISCISGESGIGKTQLIKEFIKKTNLKKKNYIYIKCSKTDNYFLNVFTSTISGQGENTTYNYAPGDNSFSNEKNLLLKTKIHLKKSLHNHYRKNADNKKFLIVIDDVQWLDQMSLEYLSFIIYTLKSLTEFKTNLIIAGRNISNRILAIIEKNYNDVLRMEALPGNDCKKLILKMLANKKASNTIIQRIMNYSDGNPFAVSEYTSSYIKGNISISGLTLNLKNTLNNKISRLSDKEQNLLFVMANAGKSFQSLFLNYVSQKIYNENADNVLKNLIEEGFIMRNPSVDMNHKDYIFRHDIVFEYVNKYFKDFRNKTLTTIIAESFEEFYSENSAAYYKKILELYKITGNNNKIKSYCFELVNFSFNNYMYKDVLSYSDYLKNNFTLDWDEKAGLMQKQIKSLVALYKKDDAIKILTDETKKTSRKNIEYIKKLKWLLVYTYYKNNQFNDAVKKGENLIKKEVTINSLNKEIYFDLFLSHLEMRNFDKCKKLIKDIKTNPVMFKNDTLYRNKVLEYERKLNIKINKYDAAIEYGMKLLPESIQQNDWISVGLIYEDIAICYYFKGSFKESIKYYEKAVHIMEKYFLISGLVNLYGNIAQIYNLTGQNNKAVYYTDKKLKLCEDVNDEKELAYTHSALAAYNLNAKNHEQAYQHLKISEKLFLKYKLWGSYSYLLGSYSIYYEDKKDFDNALKCLNLQIKIDRKYNNIEAFIRGLNNKGTLFSKFKHRKKALTLFKKAYTLCLKHKFDYLKMISAINLSWRSISLNKFNNVLNLLTEAQVIAVKNNLINENLYIEYLKRFFQLKLSLSRKKIPYNKISALINEYKEFISSNKILYSDEEVMNDSEELNSFIRIKLN